MRFRSSRLVSFLWLILMFRRAGHQVIHDVRRRWPTFESSRAVLSIRMKHHELLSQNINSLRNASLSVPCLVFGLFGERLAIRRAVRCITMCTSRPPLCMIELRWP